MSEKEPEAKIFDFAAFQQREEEISSSGLHRSEVGISKETIHERLVELGKEAIITSRLVEESGVELSPKEKSAVKQIRNLIMRELPTDQDRQKAVDWANEEWNSVIIDTKEKDL